MKIRKTKKGFTIVELVIVIAVIGVLTAILVPTFISLTAKANKASDQSLVANLNTALKMQEAEDGAANPTMHDAVLDLKEQGFDLAKLVTKSKESLLWNMKTNQFQLEKEGMEGDENLWKIYDSAAKAEAEHKFSVYAKEGFGTSVTLDGVGFDAGYVTNIATVTYNNASAGKEVVIRTNGGKLIINDTTDGSRQYHYGSSASVEVSTGDHCYEGHAVVAAMTINAGKVIASGDSYIGLVKAAATATLEEGQGVIVIPSNTPVADIPAAVASQIGYTVEGAKFQPSAEKEAKAYYLISDVDGLMAFATSWNNGDAANISKIKFADNITINLSETSWAPIGTWEYPFHGTIEGMGCTITGFGALADLAETYTPKYFTKGNTTKVTGYAFGLIGIAGDGDVTIKDINMKDVNIDLTSGNMVSAIIGFAPNSVKFKTESGEYMSKWASDPTIGTHNVTIENVNVQGSITADQDVAGIAGKLYNEGSQTVKNCTIDAIIKATSTGDSGRAGGIVSMISNSQNALIENCVNKQSVTATKYVGGILGYASNCTALIKSCQNSGSLSGAQKGDIWNSQNKTVKVALSYNSACIFL